MSDFSFIPPTSVSRIPGTNKAAAFLPKTSEVFKKEHDIAPIFISERMQYMPWGGDNHMPTISSISSSPTKHLAPARCSMLKSAMVAD